MNDVAHLSILLKLHRRYLVACKAHMYLYGCITTLGRAPKEIMHGVLWDPPPRYGPGHHQAPD